MKKSNTKQKQYAGWKVYTWILIFVLFFIGAINLVGSQSISPLYTGVVNEEKGAIVSYLTRIMTLSEFQNELNKYKNKYGEQLEQEVYKEEYEREKKKNELELLGTYNPQSRDVLFALSLLYRGAGNVQKAQTYKEAAEAIDPNITVFPVRK